MQQLFWKNKSRPPVSKQFEIVSRIYAATWSEFNYLATSQILLIILKPMQQSIYFSVKRVYIWPKYTWNIREKYTGLLLSVKLGQKHF